MLTRLLPAVVVALAIAATAIAVASCSSVSNQRIGIEAPPFSEATFSPLNSFLVERCGSLDCHGQPGRNFRIWGCDGMRLDAGQAVTCVPNDAGGGLTTRLRAPVDVPLDGGARASGHEHRLRGLLLAERESPRVPPALVLPPRASHDGAEGPWPRGPQGRAALLPRGAVPTEHSRPVLLHGSPTAVPRSTIRRTFASCRGSRGTWTRIACGNASLIRLPSPRMRRRNEAR